MEGHVFQPTIHIKKEGGAVVEPQAEGSRPIRRTEIVSTLEIFQSPHQDASKKRWNNNYRRHGTACSSLHNPV